METKREETNCKNLLRKKLSKEEFTEKIWEENKKYCLKKLPLAYHSNTYKELEEEGKSYMTEKIRRWDMRKTLVCAILSNQNGIGKTHLAVVYTMDLYKSKIKELEEFNYSVYEERFKELNENHKTLNDESFECELFSDYPIYGPLPAYNRNYNLDFLYVPERVLISEYKKCLDFRNNKSEDDFFKKYGNIDFLVIDDAFSTNEINQELSRSILFPILDDRISNKKKPTIIISNLTLNEIADVSSRIASRINNSMIIPINSKLEDFRSRS